MIALFIALGRSVLRDRAGLVMTFLLPPLVFLLFAAIFGASARGDVDLRVALYDGTTDVRGDALGRGLGEAFGEGLIKVASLSDLETAVLEGRADAGVALRSGGQALPQIEVLTTAGREVAAAAVAGQVGAVIEDATGQGRGDPVARRTVGRAGDVQVVYYAGAVSIMFVFFAAMHGAMTGLDERRSGLQARLSLLAGGLAPLVAGRLLWLTVVGVIQAAVVFAVALPRLPDLAPWQGVAWLATTGLAAFAAAGVALAVIGACRTREQAQPLSTFLVLLLAALGGSMAPRFLMPEAFRRLGWATPHAWVIEAYQALLWRGSFGPAVLSAWAVLAVTGVVGFAIALTLERRQMRA